MAIIPWAGPAIYPNIPMSGSIPAMNQQTSLIALLAASRFKIGLVVQIPKTGTLDGIELFGGETHSPSSITASFQDVTAGGLPDGTADQFSALASPTAFSWNVWPTMTTTGSGGGGRRAVTTGDWIAIVLEWTSTQSGEFWIHGFNNNGESFYCPDRWVQDIGAGFAPSGAAMFSSVVFRYADGTYGPAGTVQSCYPFAASATHTFNSGSTPDERGVWWTPPSDVQVSGMWALLNIGGGCDYVIYDSGSSVVASVSLDSDYVRQSRSYTVLQFAAPVTLTGGDVYRLVVKPTSGTDISVYSMTAGSNAVLGACPGGAAMYGTSRTNAGAWTDAPTERYLMGALLDGSEGSSSGGGGGSYAFVG